MARKQTEGSREPGRRTQRITFSTAGDLVEQLQDMAEQEGTASRVIDRLVRRGMAVETSEALQDHLADRLERAAQKLERWPNFREAVAADAPSERGLVGAAMVGRPDALAVLRVLDATVFYWRVHGVVWSLLRSGDEVGLGVDRDRLTSLVSTRLDNDGGEDDDSDDEDVGLGFERDRLTSLVSSRLNNDVGEDDDNDGEVVWSQERRSSLDFEPLIKLVDMPTSGDLPDHDSNLPDYIDVLAEAGRRADVARCTLSVVDAFMSRERHARVVLAEIRAQDKRLGGQGRIELDDLEGRLPRPPDYD